MLGLFIKSLLCYSINLTIGLQFVNIPCSIIIYYNFHAFNNTYMIMDIQLEEWNDNIDACMLGKWKCTFNELYSLTKNDKCIPENEILSKMGATSWLVKFNLIKTSILSYMLLYLFVYHTKYCKRLAPQNINLV